MRIMSIQSDAERASAHRGMCVTSRCTEASGCVAIWSERLSNGPGSLNKFYGGGVTVGGTTCGSAVVKGVTSTNSENIAGVLTLSAVRDNGQVTFSGDASTFHALSAKADDGIHVEADVTSTGGSIYFDGNADDTVDSDDVVTFTDLTSVVAGQSVMGLSLIHI